jgi:hypothetical protein
MRSAHRFLSTSLAMQRPRLERIFLAGDANMISANVIKGVTELLEEENIQLNPDETFGEMVARKLDITNRQSEILLERLHDGATVEEAAAAAGIDPELTHNDTLISIARAIGTALGRVSR